MGNIITKSGRKGRGNAPKWRSFEQKELVLMQFAKWYWNPTRGPLREYADKIKVSPITLNNWRKDPLFQKISEEIREELRKTVGPLIDKKLFKRAIEGSFPHMNLYYQLCGDLTTKIEHSHKPTDIPKDPEEIQKEIAQLEKEIGSLPKAIEDVKDFKRKKNPRSVEKIGKLIKAT